MSSLMALNNMLYNRHNLAVAKFAAKDGIREEINAVLFAKEKTAATDGIRLLEVSVSTTGKAEEFPQIDGISAMRGCSPFLVNAKQVAELKPKGAKHLPITEFVALKHLDDKRVEFLTTDLESSRVSQARRIDGKFPDYEQIFPKDEPKVRFKIDGAKLAELLKVMSELPQSGQVEVLCYGGLLPIELRSDNGNQKARGLIMPIRE